MSAIPWVKIPQTPLSLEEFLIFGSGKDCELILKCADGRRIVLPLSNASVKVRGEVHTESTAWGDMSRTVRYSGAGLRLVRGWVGIPGSERSEEEVEEVRQSVTRLFDPNAPEVGMWVTIDAAVELVAAREETEDHPDLRP